MSKTILALGADIKNRFLAAKGKKIYFGPEIGDLNEAANFELFKKEVAKAVKRFRPNIVACDLHPNYLSSLFAKELNLKLITYNLQPIQHHHAHIASVLYEHNINRPVIGVVFDGTGYGEDGNSWGGEFLLVNNSGFRRLAHLKYQMMPGADKVVAEPWRMVLSILGERAMGFLKGVKEKDQQLILKIMAKEINSPLSSSAGRLFDAAAALLGICVYAAYEAEGPMRLEAMCDENFEQQYKFKLAETNGCVAVDTEGLFSGMLQDLKKKRNKRLIATKFHNSIVEIVASVVKKLSESYRTRDVALSGGCFQNKFLSKKAVQKLSHLGLRVFKNERTPINDLNISLGQYYVSGCSRKG